MISSLEDVKREMSKLYEEVRNGATELSVADSLANIVGKYLKAEQLEFAKAVFAKEGGTLLPAPRLVKGKAASGSA